MTSLIGLLLAASPARRQALARRWVLEDTSDNGHLIASLYRHMTDDWHLGKFIERLPPDALLVLIQLAGVSSGNLPFGNMTLTTGLSETRLRAVGAMLDEAGIATRKCSPDSIALVDDLVPVLRRLLKERNRYAGRELRLSERLNAMGSSALQHLGDRWSIPRAYRLSRVDLLGRLEQLMASLPEVEGALATCSPMARTLFLTIRDKGGRLDAGEAARLTAGENHLRRAYDELFGLAVACSGYHGGQHVLQVPSDVGSRGEYVPEARRAPQLRTASAPRQVVSAKDDVLHDIDGLLHIAEGHLRVLSASRQIFAVGTILPGRADSVDDRKLLAERRRWAQRLASALSLFKHDGRRLVPGEDASKWQNLDRLEQSRAVFEVWLSLGQGQGTTFAGRRDRGARLDRSPQQLRHCLIGIEPLMWYTIRSLLYRSLWFTAANTDGPTGGGRLARTINRRDGSMVTALVAMHWLGVVDLGVDDGQLSAFRLTTSGAELLRSAKRTRDVVDIS